MASKDAKKKITYGIKTNAMYTAKNLVFSENGCPSFNLFINNKDYGIITLSVCGMHNIYNALASIALAHQFSKDTDIIKTALKDYHGVGRRFEFLGEYHGAKVYDDYAHHPSEIMATYNSVKNTKHKENYAIFQSHTYSRTKDHLKEFAEVLKKFDNVIIAPIYPAREENIYNVKEEDLVSLINKDNKKAIYIDSFEKIAAYIKEKVKKDDLIITIGAGPVNKVASMIVEK